MAFREKNLTFKQSICRSPKVSLGATRLSSQSILHHQNTVLTTTGEDLLFYAFTSKPQGCQALPCKQGVFRSFLAPSVFVYSRDTLNERVYHKITNCQVLLKIFNKKLDFCGFCDTINTQLIKREKK